MSDNTISAATNPLAAYMRLPGLNVQLPTGGAFFPEGTFFPAEDGSVPVFPMRAADEYLLKNADALLSGLAINKLIESCVPAIKNSSLVSTPDLDVLLMAIRAATYGDVMEVTTNCPKCDKENHFECHLPSVMGTMKTVPQETALRYNNDVVVYLRPYNLRNATHISLITFQETRKLQAVELDPNSTDATKTAQMDSSLEKIADLQNSMLSECVVKVVTPQGEVTNPRFIADFISNISSAFVNKMSAALKDLNEGYGIEKDLHVQCVNPKCKHQWDTAIEFDPSSFFEVGS